MNCGVIYRKRDTLVCGQGLNVDLIKKLTDKEDQIMLQYQFKFNQLCTVNCKILNRFLMNNNNEAINRRMKPIIQIN